ncbi:EamA family transporter [Sedimenticola hydrogenitrophicus]|uniref:EamA family transporter n=1 Tax=Sedimenticola hydrogenitrophicus TaxID=2967975 RepID=UPI0023B1FA7F|nr:EamA family transporter [Sedimenticola hydrogenitrophicus]
MRSKRLHPLVTTTIRLSTPVFAAVFALVFLDEPPSRWTMPGGAMILAGIYLTIKPDFGRTPTAR